MILLPILLTNSSLSYCNGLIECPITLPSFIIIQHAHFSCIHTSACLCSQIGQVQCWCCCCLCDDILLLTKFLFCCCSFFDLSSIYNHNTISGIPIIKNIVIVRIGIRNTNSPIPKHNVAIPKIEIQRVVMFLDISTSPPT
jgi:hypothetical protein